MAGVAGRSGGGNRTLTKIDRTDSGAPKGKLVKPDWYISGDAMTLEEIHSHIALKLKAAGATEASDSTLVANLAQQYLFVQDATLVYAKDGPSALIGRALASRVITEGHKEILGILKEFQVTPSTRNKKQSTESTGDSALDNLFNFKH